MERLALITALAGTAISALVAINANLRQRRMERSERRKLNSQAANHYSAASERLVRMADEKLKTAMARIEELEGLLALEQERARLLSQEVLAAGLVSVRLKAEIEDMQIRQEFGGG